MLEIQLVSFLLYTFYFSTFFFHFLERNDIVDTCLYVDRYNNNNNVNRCIIMIYIYNKYNSSTLQAKLTLTQHY